MPPVTPERIPAQAYTCAITSLHRYGFGLRFRVEYGRGPDYEGTIHTATDLSGQEITHETHCEDPVSFGWPSTELRDVVLPRCREMALIYNALRTERRRDAR